MGYKRRRLRASEVGKERRRMKKRANIRLPNTHFPLHPFIPDYIFFSVCRTFPRATFSSRWAASIFAPQDEGSRYSKAKITFRRDTRGSSRLIMRSFPLVLFSSFKLFLSGLIHRPKE